MIKKYINYFIILINYFIIFSLILVSINLTFFSNKSLIKVFEQRDKIIELNKMQKNFEIEEANLMIKIKSLGINSLDEDLITELAQSKLGLIKENYVFVLLDKQ